VTEVGIRHHFANERGQDVWRIIDHTEPPHRTRGHACDLLCRPVYQEES
jgi:hypothetical protein